MRNLKRVLSLALALVMMLGMMIIGANAAEATKVDFADADEITNTEAVDVMVALGVLEGDGTNFNPTDTLTREQGAKIICYMLMGPANAEKLAGTSAFTDVAADRWSAPYIAYCANLGILAGNGDGTFAPEGELTDVAFGKMLLVALGYDAEIEGYVGNNWATSIATDMIKTGIADGAVTGTVITREKAAQMALQTLEATMVEYSGGIEITNADGSKITVGAIRSEKDTPAYTYADVATPGLQFCENYFPTLKADLSGETDDFGYAAKVWFLGNSKNDNVLTAAKVITSASTAKVLASYTTTVANVSTGDLYKVTGNVGALEIYENGADTLATVTPTKGGSAKPLASYKGAQVEVVDNSGDGNADSVLVTYGYLAKVTDVVAATASADRKVKLSVYNTTATAVTNVEWTTEDFAKGDIVMVYPDGTMSTTAGFGTATAFAGKILDVKAVEDVVVGKVPTVTGTNGTSVTELVLDGTTYKVGASALATLGTASGKKVADSTYALGTTYTLYLSNGFVVGASGEAAAKNLGNYVWVVKAPAGPSVDEYGQTAYYTQVVKMDGTTAIYKSNSDPSVANKTLYKTTSAGGAYTFTAVDASNTINNTSIFVGEDTLTGALSMTDTTKSITVTTAGKAYITDSTLIIFVNGNGDKINVTTATGAISQNFVAANTDILLSKQSAALGGNYEVEVMVVDGAQVNLSENLVYVSPVVVGSTKIGNTTYSQYTVYDIQADTKTVVPAVAASTGYGISSYEIDANGVYTFFDVLNAGTPNGDGVYSVTASSQLSLYNSLLSTTGLAYNFTDLNASGAVIVNATGSAANNGLALKDLKGASTLNAEILVKNRTVISIVVTAYAE